MLCLIHAYTRDLVNEESDPYTDDLFHSSASVYDMVVKDSEVARCFDGGGFRRYILPCIRPAAHSVPSEYKFQKRKSYPNRRECSSKSLEQDMVENIECDRWLTVNKV